MGKGDKKTRRGKIIMGSYGVRRPKKKGSAYQPEEEKKTRKPKKDTIKAEVEEEVPVEKKTAVKKTAAKKSTTKKTSTKKTEEKSDT